VCGDAHAGVSIFVAGAGGNGTEYVAEAHLSCESLAEAVDSILSQVCPCTKRSWYCGNDERGSPSLPRSELFSWREYTG
jgi:hypothetical protein